MYNHQEKKGLKINFLKNFALYVNLHKFPHRNNKNTNCSVYTQ